MKIFINKKFKCLIAILKILRKINNNRERRPKTRDISRYYKKSAIMENDERRPGMLVGVVIGWLRVGWRFFIFIFILNIKYF